MKDEKGTLQVISHDNKLLNKDYVLKSNKDAAIRNDSKTARQTTIELMQNQSRNAQAAFDKQMAEDGWAGDLADGISFLWGSDNRACKVEKDLKNYNKNISDLQKAAEKGDAAFNTKFKQIYGKDYDRNAMADYVKNPTAENYEKAFGKKNNIEDRVAKYNESQQTGAAAVKTTATVAAGVAIGVATGGAGLAAVGVAAAATAGASAAINVSDRLSSDEGLKEGELTEIAKNAAWDGAAVLAGGAVGKIAGTAIKGATKGAAMARAATNTVGDVAMGAAQEYAQTGEITATGTVMNAALGSVGIAAEGGAFKKAGQMLKRVTGSDGNSTTTKAIADNTPINTTPKSNADISPTQNHQSTDSSLQTPETANVSLKSSEEPPLTQSSQVAETNATVTQKHGFLQDIMSNTNTAEKAFKNADLSNPEIRQQYIDMLEESFPGSKRFPKKDNVLNKLQSLVNHPDYANLSNTNKTIAKLKILRENPIIENDLYTKNKVPANIKRRVSDIEYCLQDNVPKESAAALYREGDYETFKILNDIDTSSKLTSSDLTDIDNNVSTARNNGHLMVKQSHITNPRNIPTKTISKNGVDYNVKVLDLTDSEVLANPVKYGLEAGTTADNLRLTVHMNPDINRYPKQVVKRMMNSENLNLSATFTDGNNNLYGNIQQGIVLDYRQGAVSYASNYAADTGFIKTRTEFANAKHNGNIDSHGTYIRDRFIERMKQQGVEVSKEDYAKLSNMFKDKVMTTEQIQSMADNGQLTINGKKFSAEQVQKALEESSEDLFITATHDSGKKFAEGFNEVNIYNPEIKALYIRGNTSADNLENLVSPELLKFAQENNLPIVFQRSMNAA